MSKDKLIARANLQRKCFHLIYDRLIFIEQEYGDEDLSMLPKRIKEIANIAKQTTESILRHYKYC